MKNLKNIDSNDYDYDYIGIRVIDNNNIPEIGEELNNSFNWADDEILDEAEGTSCLSLNYEKNYKMYCWEGHNKVILIGANRMTRGEDEGELLLSNAICLEHLN